MLLVAFVASIYNDVTMLFFVTVTVAVAIPLIVLFVIGFRLVLKYYYTQKQAVTTVIHTQFGLLLC